MRTLEKLRSPLLQLHRTLLESARADYERSRGRLSAGEFLQALISDPELEWLKPLTALVAGLDECLGNERLQSRYREALQRHPELVVAHGQLAHALS